MIIDDFFKLDAPQFIPNYNRKKKYGYKKRTKKRENLIKLLYATSHGYCMYCYTRIVIDRKEFGQLEHSIEKASDNGNILENCILNISIACPACNNKFKKHGEQERIKYIRSTVEYQEICKKECSAPKCYEMCNEYRNLRKTMQKVKPGHILFQPLSHDYPQNLHPSTNNKLRIQYDLLKGEFIPNEDHNFEEFEFVTDHINMFHLNDSDYRTNEIFKFCKDVVNNPKGELGLYKYNNYMVDTFICRLNDYTKEKVIKICELIYLRGLILRRNMD